jgi:predicted ATPase
MLRQMLITSSEHFAPEEQLAQLASRLELAGLKPTDAIPLVAPLLNLPLPPDYPPSPLSPEQQRRRLLATLVDWVLGSARAQPLIIATEDLHWVDPSTLELVQLLVEQGGTARLLLLYTARPEFHAPWPSRAHHTQINLNRLTSGNVRTMVAQVAAKIALSDETIATVVECTGGVPLFVEELTRAVLESGDAQLTGREIPATLHDSLMARLDRLGKAKEVIQIGAVIGSEFSYELIHAVHPIPDEDLQGAIHSATDAELVYVHGIPPDATYQFKHALIRDAAYEALLRSRRKELHSRIAEVLVRQFPERMTSAPELLAHHYTEANLVEQAIPYWQRAGQRAAERSANVEAIAHLSRGLELLKMLPDTLERAQLELALQHTLGTPLVMTRGFAAPEVKIAYARARELCQLTGETSQLFAILRGLWEFYEQRAEYQTAQEVGEQILALAERQPDPTLLLVAHNVMGDTLFWLGEFTVAREHLEQGTTLYDLHQDRSYAFLYGYDPGVACLSFAAIILWLLGYPDQALKKSHAALSLARELSHPFTFAIALHFACRLHHLRREAQAAQEHAETEIALSTEQGFAQLLEGGSMYRGWALVEQGQGNEGIAQIHHALIAWQAMGTEMARPYFLALLAEAFGKVGEAEQGPAALVDALSQVEKTVERWCEAELYRLKGQIALQSGNLNSNCQPGHTAPGSQSLTEAEACFRRATEIARQQSAKSWELRATTSLAQLLAHQGRRDEAGAVLADIYGWFTEGFDTADLKDAKALLDELAD